MLEALVLTSALLLGQAEEDANAPIAVSYVFAQTKRVDVGGGLTRVSAETNVPTPRRGYFPLRVFVDNTLGPSQVVRIAFVPNAAGGRPISKNVEVRAGERRTVLLPVPYLFRYGSVRVRGPGITEKGDQHVYFDTTYAPQRPVLSIGSPEQFEKWIGVPQARSSGDLNVFSLAPEDAPTELAVYIGYDAVVVPAAALETLNEGQRRALEAYAATGGTLVLGLGGRGLGSALPLLDAEARRDQQYGLGRLVVCGDGCRVDLGGFFAARDSAVSPRAVPNSYQRNSYRYANQGAAFAALLPQATAPIGRFLLIIALFTLAIGPGSVWVARRRGPAALLLTIPATAFITCASIIGFSLIQDGFTVHASTQGVTLLDSKQHRALQVGLTAYYANLAPGGGRFSQLVAVVPPAEGSGEAYGPGIEWGESASISGDFVPSRTYREWGYISSEPTRARVVIKKKGDEWMVQNALGFRLERLVFMADDALWEVQELRDGSEGSAFRAKTRPQMAVRGKDRFSARVIREVERPLKEGEFLAVVEGQGFAPSGGLRLNHHASSQLVRGEVER